MSSDQESITRLLQEWSNGNKTALDSLMPLVYEQLHKLAMRCMRSERQDHTLRATALVLSAAIKLELRQPRRWCLPLPAPALCYCLWCRPARQFSN
jgi:ECF sigma factor